MSSYELILKDQQQRALQLVRGLRCPHCHASIPLLDALCMVRGHGYVYYLNIQLPDGTIVPMRERDFSPQTMLVADE